ncbi:putative glycosyltransferase [Lewinella aquimaris]|uniref:Putative glycosyltransferase n=1 Tax=Neolewinella aquimaris TaxID=1835722 RepID=A0A840E520_9BACT|nr:hypothetical protein [Neolewinella aquimaris]MBB4078745.1 putative glycosyltransferase [Neolewinella aquimaris]
MPRPVAFYVHHHGSGHANRTRLLAAHLPADTPIHVLTSAADRFTDWTGGKVHPLPPDVSPDRDPQLDILENQVVHYAPVDLSGAQQRMAILSAFIARNRPAWFIIDLSVEIALFVRLCGVRVALVRLHGYRDDPAHLAAFRLADRLIAPFPPQLEDEHTPEWVRQKTTYLGAFSRYDHRKESRRDCRLQLGLDQDSKVATVINGLGGGAQELSEWVSAARANPDWRFLLIGKVADAFDSSPVNLRRIGMVADTFPYLKAADVVVGSGGTNTMMEIGAARVPFISRPEPRPFGEQVCKMRALRRVGLTDIVTDTPDANAWGPLLDRASKQEVSGWDVLYQEATLETKLRRFTVEQ